MENGNLNEVDPNELLVLVAGKNLDAFNEIYNLYNRLIYTVVYQVLNNFEDTDDVMQEVFVQIWNKAPSYNPEKGRAQTWLTTMARNKAIDRLRSKTRRNKLGKKMETEVIVQSLSSVDNLFKSVALKEEGEVLHQAVLKLSDEQRTAIQLSYLEGLTQSQIAERLGEPLGTIKARLRRGILKLRVILGNRVVEPMMS